MLLPVYSASPSDLTVVQRFLTRCYKRRYTSVQYNIYDLVEKHDRKELVVRKKGDNAVYPTFYNIKQRLINKFNTASHSLYNMLPKIKPSSQHLRKTI